MRSPTTRSGWSVAFVALVFCATLFGASAAYATLPSGWVLQNSWENAAIVSVSFINSNQGWVLFGNNSQLSMTTNGGATWQDVSTSGFNTDIECISFATSNIGWAVGGGSTVYKTTDGGSTWTTATTEYPSGVPLHKVQAVDTNHVWAVGEATLILSTSDGSTWATATVDGVNLGSGGLLGLHMEDATHGWASGYDQTGKGMVVALGSNGHWAPQASGSLGIEPLSSVWFTDNLHGWVVGHYFGNGGANVYATSNGGVNWALRASTVTTQDPYAICFVNQTHGFIGTGFNIDHNKSLLESTDGGAHWTAFDPSPTGEYASMVLAFASPDANHLWAGGAYWVADPAGVWAFRSTTATTKQLIGEPIIKPQFPKTPFTVEDHDWLKTTGTLAPKHKPGTYSIRVVLEKRVGTKWVVKRSYKAKLSKSGWSYSTKVKFPSAGRWRIRAMHGSGKSAIKSSYTYYKVIVDDWDIP
jgi:photosystem II stability/assembly factor-like uncharacterized protein